ncbi:hypothetical protein BASA81_001229 [Batrachochytrium salamandrivorans]|nr:hypothetical protein BASA81_001229 [Batrachochytrium salamandrivorans]
MEPGVWCLGVAGLELLLWFVLTMAIAPLPLSLLSLIALWPGLCLCMVFGLYFTREKPISASLVFGKPVLFGQLHYRLAQAWMAPVLVPLHLATWLCAEPRSVEVTKGLFLGNSPTQFPFETTTVVDVCAEFSPQTLPTMRYLTLPSLVGRAALPIDLCEVCNQLVDQMSISNMNLSRRNSSNDPSGFGIRGRGTIYCFDRGSLGLERAVVFALVLLVMRNESGSVEDALELVRKSGLDTRPNSEQLAAANEAVMVWRQESPNRLALV